MPQINSNDASWRRWLWPIASRKVQVAIATLIVAYASQAGLLLNEDNVVNVIAIGAALILGIAHEDAAEKSSRRG